MDFFLHYIWRIKKKYYLCKELKNKIWTIQEKSWLWITHQY